MKIVSWNIRALWESKVTPSNKDHAFTPTFAGYGLGNNILDYIVRLVTGSPDWNNIPDLSANPVDVFTIVELKTNGSKYDKGKAVSGSCIPSLKKIIAAMNAKVDKSKYNYTYIIPPSNTEDNGPLIIGRQETVGIIFNTKTLRYVNAAIFRNLDDQQYFLPRTPYGAQFEIIASPKTYLQIIGVHAARCNPKGDYTKPVQYCRDLPYTGVLNNTNWAQKTNTLFMGDFNCNAGSSYEGYDDTKKVGQKRKLVAVYPFKGLFDLGYVTHLSNDALSSMKKTLEGGTGPPYQSTAYLSDAFDNIIMNGPSGATASTAKQQVVNMIGYARDMNKTGQPLLVNSDKTNYASANCVVTSFNQVSDHLPVVIEW